MPKSCRTGGKAYSYLFLNTYYMATYVTKYFGIRPTDLIQNSTLINTVWDAPDVWNLYVGARDIVVTKNGQVASSGQTDTFGNSLNALKEDKTVTCYYMRKSKMRQLPWALQDPVGQSYNFAHIEFFATLDQISAIRNVVTSP